MPYITRRIIVSNPDGEEEEYFDTEFFSLTSPLVVVGEPGAGKSELLSLAGRMFETRIYNASTIDALQEFEKNSEIIIIDGIDEITSYETGTPINRVLAKIPETAMFILSCRAVDWQDTINKTIIEQKWNQLPIVGRIAPLNHEEIVDFINAKGDGQNGDAFLKEARERDIFDLLQNPQNLVLLLNAVRNKGWPNSRLELFDYAISELVKEHNEYHSSIDKTRPSNEQLIEAAGFICTQLLLAGKANIRLDGQGDDEYPAVSELISTDININVIQSTLSTKLFHLVGSNHLEPCHRTISEFLSAKWIAKALQNQLSLRRLENLIYSNNYIVPAALRGLHAWIATFCSSTTSTFIERDPYGFFRYGDPAILTISQVKDLLSSLKSVAESDPYFCSEDWPINFGRGLARRELRDDILRVILNPKSPYQLSVLMIKTIQGDAFSDDIVNELLEIVIDNSKTPAERLASSSALLECNNQPNWIEIIGALRKNGDIESLRIALKIVQSKIKVFNGTTVGNILVEFGNKNSDSGYYGIGYGLQGMMSISQLEECLEVLADAMTENRSRGRHGDTEDWLLKFIQERFERGSLPSAEKLWSWIKHFNRHNYCRQNWDKFSEDYYSKNYEERLSIQAEALKSTRNPDELWIMLFRIVDASPGLMFRENDLIVHLEDLIADRNSYLNWDQRWRILVRWGQLHGFSEDFMKHARKQALNNKILLPHLKELEKPPERAYEKDVKERELKNRDKKQREMLARHQRFEKIQDKLISGEHLDALHIVANAYLGRFYDLNKASSPMDRVIELVGIKMAPIALKGLAAASARDDIPTPRQIMELHAGEQKQYFFESILVAHCAIMDQNSKNLADLSINIVRSSLAACHWDLQFGDDFTSDLQNQLEKIVFEDKGTKEVFVRDTMEPYLIRGKEHVPGLYRLVRDKEFSDMAGSLTIEWIKKYAKLSNNSLRELIFAAIHYGHQNRLMELVREYISKEKWNGEDKRSIWLSVAFLLDFSNYSELLTSFAKENKEHLWPFKTMAKPEHNKLKNWPTLNAAQNHFLIKNFGPLWPMTPSPSQGWCGDKHPWDASEFIIERINDLAADLSNEAEVLLSSLLNVEGLEGYQNHIKHVYAQQTRNRAEGNKALLPISEVRKVLLTGEPASHDDFQALLLDELNQLQERIRNSTTNDLLTYWNGDAPHEENYCRDRIASAMTPYLERCSIRTHTEGSMPDSKRCDLLNTSDSMNLPIEIKGQWHKDLWTSASVQLQNYSREYHSNGRGIYLVLWFGYIESRHPKNPHGWKGQRLPKTLTEMKNLLSIKYENISEKTKIFVLDLSKKS